MCDHQNLSSVPLDSPTTRLQVHSQLLFYLQDQKIRSDQFNLRRKGVGLGVGGTVAETPRRCRVTIAATMDENGSDTNRYHSYYICFHISIRIRIRTRIAFGYIYEYGLTRLRIRIMSIEYGMNRIRRRSDTNIYSDIE